MLNIEVLIIGQGPAGLSAAIYTSRAGLKTFILGCDPKIAGDYEIDNYFGFPETISGRDLMERGVRQASRFGTRMACEKALSIHWNEDGLFRVVSEREEFSACTVILATGVSRRKPDIGDLEKFEGRGVSYCVSCDGFFFKGKRVLVAGEGNYAANQAIELLSYTPHVSLATLGRPPAFSEDFTVRLRESNIAVIEKKISSLQGENSMSSVLYEDGSSDGFSGLFVALGDASSLDFARSLGIFTEGIFIKADEKQATNVPGIFAAGDCTGGFLQISKAVGEGAVAARSAIDFIKAVCRK